MTLKLFFAGFMVFAHQRFLQNKGLVLLTLSSFAATIIISFLHGFVPGFLASITDAIAGIVVAIIAVIWAIFFLVGSIISIVKAIA
jgi:VanZ family protein